MATELNQGERDSNRAIVSYTADETESLSDAVIVAARMAATRVQSADDLDEHAVGVLDPLFDTVDLDALDALFSPTADGRTRSGTVTFTHDGFEITAYATGEVRVVRT